MTLPPISPTAGRDPREEAFSGLTRDLTSAPVPQQLLKLALPVLASQVLRMAYLGVPATAAVTTSLFVMWWVYSLNDMVGVGVVAYISQLLGAGDRQRAGLAAYRALRASALLGLPAVALGLSGAYWIYGLLGATPEVVQAGGDYLSVVLCFSPLFMMALTCEGIMRGSGDTRTPFLIDLAAVGLNALLDPFLIFGIGPFPRLGVAGAAWATVIAWTLMLAAYLGCAWRRHPAFPVLRRAPGEPVKVLGLMRVGVPVSLIGALFSLVYLGFARIAAGFGAASMAVVGIVNRIESLSFTGTVSIGAAAAVLVGQNLGAGRPDRAEQAIRVGVRWGAWLAMALTAVLLLWPGFFLTLFSRDAEVHRLGAPYLRILALCLIANAVEIVTAEAVIGSGHTTAVSLIFSVTSLVRIPLAAAASYGTGLGPLGIAWTITLTCVGRAIVIWWWFSKGTWKRGLGRGMSGAGGSG